MRLEQQLVRGQVKGRQWSLEVDVLVWECRLERGCGVQQQGRVGKEFAASVVEREGGKGPGQSVGGAGQGGVGRVVALPTWEARSWEEDIVWGDSSAGEEEEDGDCEEKDVTGKQGPDNDDEFDQDADVSSRILTYSDVS